MRKPLPRNIQTILEANKQLTGFSDALKAGIEEKIMENLARQGMSEEVLRALEFEYSPKVSDGVTVRMRGQEKSDRLVFDDYFAALESRQSNTTFRVARGGGHASTIRDVSATLQALTTEDMAAGLGIERELGHGK